MTHETNRTRLPLLVFLATVVTLGVVAQPAAAGAWFSVGGAFTVGGVRFQMGIHDYVPARPAPARYYRVDHPLRVNGARCSDRCYVQRGYHYHHESCPLVRAYFGRYGYSTTRLAPIRPYPGYAPPPYVVYRSPRPYRHVYPTYPAYPAYRVYRVVPQHDSRGHGGHGRGHGHHRWDDRHTDRRRDRGSDHDRHR